MAMDPNDPRVQEYLRSQSPEPPKPPRKAPKRAASPTGEVPVTPGETKQRRLFFKRRRAGVVLSREEVRAIKDGRKKLRRELKDRGIRSRRDFELTAGSLGLYFDKRGGGLLLWLRGHWLGALLAALLLLLLVLFIFGMITQLRGFFTINLSGGLFREGFTLSDDEAFTDPTSQLYAIPAEGVPCISIDQIEEKVNETDGEHNRDYFAYTFYIRNEGESTVDFAWSLELNAESRDLSDCCWVLLFVDGVPTVYAEPSPERGTECLPDMGDDTRGYLSVPVLEYYGSDQLRLIRRVGGLGYSRVVSQPYEDDWTVASGTHLEVVPMETHKYTVVLWLEGDDHECNNDKIGGYLGMEMNFRLLGEETGSGAKGSEMGGRRHSFWDNLRFWD